MFSFRHTNLAKASVLLVTLFALTGCSLLPKLSGSTNKESPEDKGSGRLMVTASLAGLQVATLSESKVVLTLSKDGRDRTQELPIIDSEVSANVSDLLPGVWQIIMRIHESTGTAIYEAKANVSVMPGGTATVPLVLKPLHGTLEVTVDPSVHPDLAAAKRGRVYVNPGGYSTMSENDYGGLTATKELAPGTYDFSIALYSESFYAADRLYESPWTTVSIEPGRTTRVTWNPVTGSCTIGGRIDTPPAAPTGVEAVKVPQGIAISWQPVPNPEGDLARYRIYLRQDPLEKFDLGYELDADRTSYIFPSSELKKDRLVEITITAVDAGGQESSRSQVVTVDY